MWYNKKGMKKKTAYFGAGCFWHVEEKFRTTDGVLETHSGFMGGDLPNPSYKKVCGGDTGHAETVKVVYDADKVSYQDLLDKFWDIHDPTQLNRQGPDIGSQYRSIIFYTNEDQKEKSLASKKKMESLDKYKDKVVTQIEPAENFYKAEEYHQKYKAKKKGLIKNE